MSIGFMQGIKSYSSASAMANQLTVENNHEFLKIALVDTLTATFSSDAKIRESAEDQLKLFEVTDEYGVLLAELATEIETDRDIRQQASVLLKHFVQHHWCSQGHEFVAPEIGTEAKYLIRAILPNGLQEKSGKIRGCISRVITLIGRTDWPEDWPTFFTVLSNLLSTGNEWSVYGVLEVLEEFSSDLDQQEIMDIANIYVSAMARLFVTNERYNIRARGKSISVFRVYIKMVCTASKNRHYSCLTEVLSLAVNEFSKLLLHSLEFPDAEFSDFALLDEVIQTLTLLVKEVPDLMMPYSGKITMAVWETVRQTASAYLQFVVNCTANPHPNTLIQSHGITFKFEDFVFNVLEFIEVLAQSQEFANVVENFLSETIYHLIVYAQITNEEIVRWSADPNKFVDNEEDYSFSYSVRSSAQDLLLLLAKVFGDSICGALQTAITLHVEESNHARSEGFSDWWKVHEASMFLLGSVRKVVVAKILTGNVDFNLGGFFQVVVDDMTVSDTLGLLRGRCVWLGGRCARLVNQQLIVLLLESVITGLQPTQTPFTRILSVRAIWEFCHQLKVASLTALLTPLLHFYLEQVVAMATFYSGEVLVLILEAVTAIVEINTEFALAEEKKIIPLALALFIKYNSEKIVLSMVIKLLTLMGRIPEAVLPLHGRVLPTLAAILKSTKYNSAHCASFQIVQALVRVSDTPLSTMLINVALPSVFNCATRTEDGCVLRNAGECLRMYISMSPNQICSYVDSDGKTGLAFMLEIASLLLSPSLAEDTAADAGRFLITLIMKAGSLLGEGIDLILKAVLTKMQRAQTPKVKQSLIMVYAHLIHTHLDAVLDFLSTVPGPMGESALDYVLEEWCARQQMFNGCYESKASYIALSKLLQYGMSSNDKRITMMTVSAESNSASFQQKKRRPLMAKILKILIFKLHEVTEINSLDDSEDDDSDDTDDEDSHDLIDLNDLDSMDDDLVALEDPIYQVELTSYLTEFLQTFRQQPAFSAFIEHLSNWEKDFLTSLDDTELVPMPTE